MIRFFLSVYFISLTLVTTAREIPQPPTLKPIAFVSNYGVHMQWSAVQGVSNYRIDLSKDNFSTFVNSLNNFQITSYSSPIVSNEYIGLQPNTKYQLRIRAENGEGQSLNSNVVEFTTLPNPPESSANLWVEAMGSTGDDLITALAVDGNENIYAVGYYSGEMNVGGITLQNNGGRDAFIVKYNSSGVVSWAKSIGGSGNDELSAITINGNDFFIYGSFSGTINCDLNGGTSNLNTRGGGAYDKTGISEDDGFIARYSLTDRSLVWAKSLGDAYPVSGTPIVSDGTSLFVTGILAASNDFDPGAGTNTLTTVGDDDPFIASYSVVDGSYNWAVNFGSTSMEWGRSLMLHDSYLYAVGDFTAGADLDPGPGVISPTTHGCYISKFNKSNGTLSWAKTIAGTSIQSGTTVSVASAYDISKYDNAFYVIGTFQGEVDFDPGNAVNAKQFDIQSGFFAQFSLDDGNFNWVKVLNGTAVSMPRKISANQSGVFLAGSSAWFTDFNPEGGGAVRASMNYDIFLARYLLDGSFISAKTIGGGYSESIRGGFAIAPSGYYVAGGFQTTAWFDPYVNVVEKISVGSTDAFLAKYEIETTPSVTPVALAAIDVTEASFTANWNAASLAAVYRLDVSLDQNFTTFLSGYKDRSVSALTSVVPGLAEGTTYYYRIRSVNDAGVSSNSNVITVTTLVRQPQTISFSVIEEKTFGDKPFSVAATSSSGLAIIFSATSDKVSVSGNIITILKPGSVTITATQPESAEFKSASTSQTFCVKPARPSITAGGNAIDPVLNSSSTFGNQWFKDGSIISDAGGSSFEVTASGLYQVQVKADNCTSALSDGFPIVITGDLAGAGEVSLYPNPAINHIILSGLSTELNNFILIDMIGRKTNLPTEKIELGTFQADISQLENGIYLIQVPSTENARMFKFVKNK